MDTLGACSTSTTELLELVGATNPMPHYVQPVQAPTIFYHPSKTALFLVDWSGRPASDHCPHYSLPMLDNFNQS
ncbi:unnamed protein product [Sphagnum troendelagicum]|uniref:Uncharacterized protein n=1 Tax=Sphagnum troendelagicum TaxID=128251 RepID=A0ABP0UAK8_9BRYO